MFGGDFAGSLIALFKISYKYVPFSLRVAKWVEFATSAWYLVNQLSTGRFRILYNNFDMPRAHIATIIKRDFSMLTKKDHFALADSFGIKRCTVYAIVRSAEGRGRVEELPRGRRRVKVDEYIRRELEILVNESPAFTLLSVNECHKKRI